jgi:hypothetical protein
LCLLGDGTTTIQTDAQLSTSSLLDFVKDNGIEDSAAWQTRAEKEVLGGVCAPEHVALDCTAGLDFADNALLDGLPDLRHTDENGGLQLANVTGAVADRGVGQGADGAVSQSSSPVEHSVLEDELEDMGSREIGKKNVSGSEVFTDDGIDTSDCSC